VRGITQGYVRAHQLIPIWTKAMMRCMILEKDSIRSVGGIALNQGVAQGSDAVKRCVLSWNNLKELHGGTARTLDIAYAFVPAPPPPLAGFQPRRTL